MVEDKKKGVKNAGFVALGLAGLFAGFMLIVLAILAYMRSKRSSSKPKKNMADFKPADEAKEEDSDDEHKIDADKHVLEMTNYQADHEEKDINYL